MGSCQRGEVEALGIKLFFPPGALPSSQERVWDRHQPAPSILVPQGLGWGGVQGVEARA